MTTATREPVSFRRNRPLQAVCGVFLILWIISGIRPIMVEDWWLENGLVFVFVAVLVATYRRLPLSQASYLLIFAYLLMHEWGAHHRYADVPLGEWMKPWLDTTRNDYDRVVHFAFGLLLGYPLREILMRKAGVRGGWSYTLPVVILLGFGAAYEILEAIAAATLRPELGDAFLSLQGDPWDTHKDMFMGLAGAVVSMGGLAIWQKVRGQRLMVGETQ
jgi:putative membrane protein